MRLKILLGTIALVGLAKTVHAQSVTTLNIKIFIQGASSPIQQTPLAPSAFVCGQTPKLAITPPTTNPKKIAYDDPAAPTTADCVYTDPGTGPLAALPFGPPSGSAYVVVISAVNSAGTGPDSLASNPFSKPGTVPPALTGVRVGG